MDNVTAFNLTEAINRLCSVLDTIRKEGVTFTEDSHEEVE